MLSLLSKKKMVVSLPKNSNQNTLSQERDSQQRRSSSVMIFSWLKPLNQLTLFGKTDTGPQRTTFTEHSLHSHSSSSSSVFHSLSFSIPRSTLLLLIANIQMLTVTILLKSMENQPLKNGLTQNMLLTTMLVKEKKLFHSQVLFNASVMI